MASPRINAEGQLKAMSKPGWQNVKDVFHEALRRDPPNRDAYLDKACVGNLDLRIEVESLLISLEEAKSFLEMPIVGERPQPNRWQFECGQSVSHYEIIEPIASGGMGEVYLAKDLKLRRNVALKVLSKEMVANKDRMRRFRREADIISALNHPNIITIFEFDADAGFDLLASEFVNGKTLRETFRRGPMSVCESIDIAIQVASALDAAHKAGVIHRDIKPENIMVREDGYVKVLDFGLAKLAAPGSFAGPNGTNTRDLSRPGLIMGTVNYMSPEQTRGMSIDERSDIFSLGVLLHEMLTGEVPFTGETTADVIAAIIQTEPRAVSTLNSTIPKEMDAIVAKCLEKKPEHRFHAVEDVQARLVELRRTIERREFNAALDPAPDAVATKYIEAPQPQAGSLVQTSKRKRVLFAAVFLLLITAIASLTYWWFTSLASLTPIESIAVMPFVNESGNADVEYLSDGMTELLINALSRIDSVKVKARSSVFRYKGQTFDGKLVASELGVQALVYGRVVQVGDDLTVYISLDDAITGDRIWGTQYSRKLADLPQLQSELANDVAKNLTSKLLNKDRERLSKTDTEDIQAFQYYLRGRYQLNRMTDDGFRKAVELFKLSIARDQAFAMAYAGLAEANTNLGVFNVEAPHDVFPLSRSAALTALTLDPDLARAYSELAMIKMAYEWDRQGAAHDFAKAVEINPSDAESHLQYAFFLAFGGEFERAEAEMKRSIEIDPASPGKIASLAQIYFFARRYNDAIEQANIALELDPNLGFAHWTLGLALLHAGSFETAIQAFRRSIPLSGDSPDEPASLAIAHAMMGDKNEARKILGELEHRRDGKYISPGLLAAVYASLGERDKAFALLDKAMADKDIILASSAVDPLFDPLRDDPRFTAIMHQVGVAR
jgi:serine/threonine protein kinase/tetratricopeptide (TPR) repeat protein